MKPTKWLAAVALFFAPFAAHAQLTQRPVSNTHECYYHDAFCNSTTTDTVNIYGCRTDDFHYLNAHQIHVEAGYTLTVTLQPYGFRPFIGISAVGNDRYLKSASGTTSGQSLTLSYVAPSTGEYEIWVGPATASDTGTYQLSVLCTTGSPSSEPHCVPDQFTACLLNNRFKATLKYRGVFDNNRADTNASVKTVTGFGSATSETVFFYFNSPNNIEMLVKMLDQGNTNGSGQPTVAVLYGSATPLRAELTITDTKNGTTRTYTSEFGKMQGGTDFTAFVK
ncbi:MAG TPA: hypothetical protein VF824_09805 [Thermoanaerobaculia bacterium]|jgi:hypothetical protein